MDKNRFIDIIFLCLLVADWFVDLRAKTELHYKREQSIWLECHSDAAVVFSEEFSEFSIWTGRKERWMNWPPMEHKRCAYIISLYSCGSMLGVQSEMDDDAVRNGNNIIHKGYSFALKSEGTQVIEATKQRGTRKMENYRIIMLIIFFGFYATCYTQSQLRPVGVLSIGNGRVERARAFQMVEWFILHVIYIGIYGCVEILIFVIICNNKKKKRRMTVGTYGSSYHA